VFNLGIIIIFVMLMIYTGFESWRHKVGAKFGHEASLVTTIGLALSGLALIF